MKTLSVAQLIDFIQTHNIPTDDYNLMCESLYNTNEFQTEQIHFRNDFLKIIFKKFQ